MNVIAVVLLVLLVVAAVLALVFRARAKATEALRLQLEERVRLLSRYEGILDAEARARKVQADAQKRADEIVAAASAEAAATVADAESRLVAAQERGEGILAAANESAAALVAEGEARYAVAEIRAQALEAGVTTRRDAILATATVAANAEVAETRARTAAGLQEAEDVRRQSRILLEAARAEAASMIELAKVKAQEIGGEAWAAKERAEEYAKTAQAMKNLIEGYGDQYIMPTFGLLDDLAEEFGFAEGGARLKEARDRTRAMVVAHAAGECEYVQGNRQEIAVSFVVDAFNGKVDTILAAVRHDNFGTLKQKIEDAFTLVNQLGRAFKNARITTEYRDARLDELRWAVVANELKLRDREEQRTIKERIREEEKAQREYERAMKEAAKEEETLKKLQAKLQADYDKATDEQKAKYENQLTEVNEKLKAAEEKNLRALSMAQQTRAGHVYIISNVGSFGESVYKIGLTRRLEPEDRVRELGGASVPFAFDIHAMIRSDDAPTLERQLHKLFVQGQMNKVNARKEFFRVSLHDIRKEVEKTGQTASWTMTADATEYRETLAIEQQIKEKKLDSQQWASQQIKEHDSLPLVEADEVA